MIDKEKVILETQIENYPCPVSKENTEKILKQMEHCVCRIYCDKKKGTGFFTKIENKPYLITNNHVVKKEEFTTQKEIKYFLFVFICLIIMGY